MNVRNQIRQLLRMCGHALVSTVHERLDGIEHCVTQVDARTNELSADFNSMAESAGAMLQGSIRILELLQEVQECCPRKLSDTLTELKSALDNERQVRMTESKSILDNEAARQVCMTELKAVLDNEVARQVCIEVDDYEYTNPETGLMSFLYSYLPARRVLDIGAHQGDVSERLLKAGFEVWAFEPAKDTYGKLVQRLGSQKGFHSFQFAIGSSEAEMPLHRATDLSGSKRYDDTTVFNSLAPHSMPEDLPFTTTVLVKVRTLEQLHRTDVIPTDIGLVKIDTEGFDLEVIRGMGEIRYPVIGAEFWDTEIPFGRSGLLYTLESLVDEMKTRGYCWHIVIYRIWGRNQTAYYCNHGRAVPNSWGNVFFFKDYDLFAHAQEWCSAVLPRTYFKAARS